MSPSPPTTATPVASHHQHHRYPSPHHPHRLHLAIISPTRKPPSPPPTSQPRRHHQKGNMGAFGLLWKLGCVWFTQKLQRERLAVAQPWGAFGCGSTTRLGRLAGTTTQGVFGLLFRGTGVFGCGFNSRRDCLVHGSRKGVYGFGMTK
ncbi:hypothetical protein Tco_0122703 [Tanacetum coccineum]